MISINHDKSTQFLFSSYYYRIIIYIFMNTYVISLFFINYLFHYFRMCTRKNERRSEILFDLMILYMWWKSSIGMRSSRTRTTASSIIFRFPFFPFQDHNQQFKWLSHLRWRVRPLVVQACGAFRTLANSVLPRIDHPLQAEHWLKMSAMLSHF